MTMNPSQEEHIKDLKGDVIKEIFKEAEKIADLHATLTSPRGNYFRKRLLGKLTKPLEESAVEKLGAQFGVREYQRHIHKLINLGLVSKQQNEVAADSHTYMRTYDGEDAINAVRELERKLGAERAQSIFAAALGKNSIRLFLKVYGNPKPPNKAGDIVYTPLEIGQLTTFLPRTVEGISAIDKLDGAGLVSYLDDGDIHVNPRRSTAFYQYLKELYRLLVKVGKIKNSE